MVWNPCKTLTKNGKYFVKKNSKQLSNIPNFQFKRTIN